MDDDAPQPLDELLEEQAEEAPAEGSPTRKLPIGRIVTFVVIACVAMAAAWAVAGILSTPPVTGDAQGQAAETGALPVEVEPEREPVRPGKPIVYGIDSIIVNLRGTQARRYLKITIAFGLKDEGVRKEIESQKLVLTDRLIVLLSSKTIQDTEGYEKKEEIKREIRDDVNNLLGMKDAVTKVYFTDFLIQ